MPPAKKRKIAASKGKRAVDVEAVVDPAEETPTGETQPEMVGEGSVDDAPPPAEAGPSSTVAAEASSSATPAAAASKPQDRMARFRALQARAKTSSQTNMKEATLESQRLAADPAQLTAIQRRHAVASHKLLKADVEDAGGDFERKRAWDWTVEESEAWDKRMRKKEAHRDDNAFQDYRREAQKVYKRQVKHMNADMERYAREKMAAIEKAAANGSLEIVETEDGEMVAVDRDGTFYATANSTNFADNKPDKAAIDRLVNDIKKGEEIAMKRRRERQGKNGDDADVTYINEKNKQFNQKLARFYNKYTAEIRESFERGTKI